MKHQSMIILKVLSINSKASDMLVIVKHVMNSIPPTVTLFRYP